MNKIQQFLAEQKKQGLISEESFQFLLDAFNQAVHEKAQEQCELIKRAAVIQALKEQSQKHGKMLKRLVEALDFKHALQLKRLVEKIKHKYQKDRQKLLTFLLKETKQRRALHKKTIRQLSEFLDYSLRNALPISQFKKAARNAYAQHVLNEIRSLVGITPRTVSAEIKQAFRDGGNIIKKLKSRCNALFAENIRLQAENQQQAIQTFLEKKTAGLDEEKKRFIQRLFKGKPLSYVKENFDSAYRLIEQRQNVEEEQLRQQMLKRRRASVASTNHQKQFFAESRNHKNEVVRPLHSSSFGANEANEAIENVKDYLSVFAQQNKLAGKNVS